MYNYSNCITSSDCLRFNNQEVVSAEQYYQVLNFTRYNVAIVVVCLIHAQLYPF